jgi:hypothetical protein
LFLVGTGVAAVLLVETFSIQRELLSQIGGPKITGWLLIEKLDWFFVKAISRGDSTREQENYIIIIWLSPYVLFVQSLSPPKPAGLDSPIFCMDTHK